MKQAGCVPEAHQAQVPRCRQEAVLAQKGGELIQRDQEGEQVDKAEAALDGESGEPVIRREKPVHRPKDTACAGAGSAARSTSILGRPDPVLFLWVCGSRPAIPITAWGRGGGSRVRPQ